MRVQVLTVVEVDLGVEYFENPGGEALARLDTFRESVQPSAEYGLTIYRINPDEAARMPAGGVQLIPEAMDDPPERELEV